MKNESNINEKHIKEKHKFEIVIFATEENIYARGLVEKLLEDDFKIKAVIIEKGSKISEFAKNFLKSEFWNPPSLLNLINDNKIPVYYTEDQNNDYCFNVLKIISPDLVLIGGGRILKKRIIETAKIGILNCHPGILPKYRGMDIALWAIYNGDDIGCTCHFVDEGVDTGPILMQKKSWIEKGDNILKVRIRLQKLCIDTMIECIKGLEKGTLRALPQEGEGKRFFRMSPEMVNEVENIIKSKIIK
jgi:methionyl-tRNA formyltransferase